MLVRPPGALPSGRWSALFGLDEKTALAEARRLFWGVLGGHSGAIGWRSHTLT
jgi:hypothetical protein